MKRTNPLTSKLAHESKMKKVKAIVEEVYVEPEYIYIVNCPYCDTRKSDEAIEDNCTIKVKCFNCKKDFKVKIPKFY